MTAMMDPHGALNKLSDDERLRMGILHFLANSSLGTNEKSVTGLVNDALSNANDVHGAANLCSGMVKKRKYKFWKKSKQFKDENGNGFLDKVQESICGFIKKVFEYLKLDQVAEVAAKELLANVPSVIKTTLGFIAGNLGTVLDVAKGLYGAAQQAFNCYRTRHIENGVKEGVTRDIVVNVRSEMKSTGWGHIKDAVKSALLAGITAANAIVGSIVNAIASLFSFFSGIIETIKDRIKLKDIFQQARDNKQNKLYLDKDKETFREWFLAVLDNMPIVASYCISLPMTGSFYGFLRLVGVEDKELQRNYMEFQKVQEEAAKFVQDHAIKLQSQDIVVSMSLRQVQKSNWKSAGKSGLKSRFMSFFTGAVENAAG